jgi:hypothetical protein
VSRCYVTGVAQADQGWSLQLTFLLCCSSLACIAVVNTMVLSRHYVGSFAALWMTIRKVLALVCGVESSSYRSPAIA